MEDLTSDKIETVFDNNHIPFSLGQRIGDISTVIEENEPSSFKNDDEIVVAGDNVSSFHGSSDNLLAAVNPLMEPFKSKLSHQVRNTLKENADMLMDKNILNDLLHHEIPNSASSVLNFGKDFVIPQIPDDQEYHRLKQPELNTHNLCNDLISDRPDEGQTPFLSISSTPKKLKGGTDVHVPSVEPVNIQKHVNFAQGDKQMKMKMDNYSDVPTTDRETKVSSDDYGKSCAISAHSFTSYGPEIVFDKLSEIRTHLDLKEGEKETSSSNLPLNRLLLAKLNSQKQRTKDLEEELTLNEASLAKVTCELEVVQKRLLRREEQLRDAGDQISKLQSKWQTIQQGLIISRDAYRNENEQLKRVIESLRSEKQAIEKELNTLREENKEFSRLKLHAEGMKFQFEKSSKQSEEILEENRRLNIQLKDKIEKLNHHEKDYRILEEEKQKLEHENEALHTKLDNLVIAKNEAEEELKLLKKRHSALLQKAVEDAELKEKAVEEKNSTLLSMEKLKKEKTALVDDLHTHYQNQLQSILLKKMSEIGDHFESKKNKLHEEMNLQIQNLKRSFEVEKEDLRKGLLEDQESQRRKFEHETYKKDNDLREVKVENQVLRNQISAIASAVCTVLPKARTETLFHKDNVDRGGLKAKRNETIPETQLGISNKYHLTQIGGLEPYQVGGETQQPNKENIPFQPKSVTSPSSPQFPVPPLITSTSLSSISCPSEACSSDGVEPAREKKQPFSKGNKCKRSHLSHPKFHSRLKRFNGRKFLTAAQIVDSEESLASTEEASHSKFFKEIDKEMSELVQEVNSMSEVITPLAEADDSPRHNTSQEQDSARSALKKIDKVSNLLTRYVAGT